MIYFSLLFSYTNTKCNLCCLSRTRFYPNATFDRCGWCRPLASRRSHCTFALAAVLQTSPIRRLRLIAPPSCHDWALAASTFMPQKIVTLRKGTQIRQDWLNETGKKNTHRLSTSCQSRIPLQQGYSKRKRLNYSALIGGFSVYWRKRCTAGSRNLERKDVLIC